MSSPGVLIVARQDESIQHFGNSTELFLRDYLLSEEGEVALICGAGFDPRSTSLCRVLSELCPNLAVYLVREHRPDPVTELLGKAESNIAAFTELVKVQLLDVNILAADNAVIGGHNLVKQLSRIEWKAYKDVFIDASALSVGISFPLVRFLVEAFEQDRGPSNIHLVISQNAALDEAIVPLPVESPSVVHGFRGGWGLDKNQESAKLWLPQLSSGRNATLQRIHRFIVPHDTCPILPFPSADPRLSDHLASRFLDELDDIWQVDPRNTILADETDPLDLYRTLVQLDDLRQRVFVETGGSLLLLSPTGSKLLALGALLASLERDLPVVYMESIGYDFGRGQVASVANGPCEFNHIWLEGDAYPVSRAPLKGTLNT